MFLALIASQPMARAEWRVPLDFSNWSKPQIACQPFQTALEARGVDDWNALDIVPDPAPQPDVAEAELERIGGARLVLQVDANALRKDMLQQARDDVRRIVRNARLGSPAAVLIRGDMIEFQPRDATAAVADAFAALTSGPVPLLKSRPLDADLAARGGVAFSLSEQVFEERLRGSLQNSIESMERRVRQVGVAKGLVQATGDGRILMITPGLKEPERLFQLLDSRARLAFRAVDRSADPCHVETPPADSEILRDHATKAPLLVQRHVLAGGENVVAVAVVRQADAGTAAVAFRLDANGASRLAEASQPGGAVIAILLDNEIIAAPTIRARIADGAVLLSGGLTLPQAKELALLLRAGFMSAPLAIIERQIVEPKSR